MATHEIPAYRRLGVEVVEASGVNVLTRDGREMVDFYGGHAVALLGYRHPRLLEVLRQQAEQVFFQTNLVDLEVRDRAFTRLAGFAPEGLDRVFLVNSGAEANENALRLACRFTERSRIVALTGGFHGRTAAAAACSDGAAKWYGFPRTPFDVTFVPGDDAAALEAAVGADTAAVILEPVQGLAGAVDLDLDYLRTARQVTRDRGAWLIADEVQCGMGRTGHAFAIDAAGVVPDVVTCAKGLAGGFPAGAVILPEAVAAQVQPGDLGTTFGGGPLAAALIAEVVWILEMEELVPRAGQLGALIRETCRVGPVRDVQGRGLLAGLVTEPPASEVLPALRQRGILAGGARDPHVVRLMPPLTIEEAHVQALARALSSL